MYKLAVFERHGLLPIVPIVFVAKLNFIILQADNALITNRDSMGVSGKIADDAVGSVETVFAIYHPVFLHQGIEHFIDLIFVSDATEFPLACTVSQCTDQVASVKSSKGQSLIRYLLYSPQL